MTIQKIHYKIRIRKGDMIKTYYSKYLNIDKVEQLLEEQGWKILAVIPAGKVKYQKGMNSMKTLNRKQFIDLVCQVCKVWDIQEPIIVFRKLDENTGAVALRQNIFNIPVNVLVVSGKILQLNFNAILNIIYHELTHFTLEAGDNDFYFQFVCKINNFWLNQNDKNIWNGELEEGQELLY